MSYILHRIHWKIIKNGTPNCKNSFHLSEDDVAQFIRETVTTNSDGSYKVEGVSEIHHADGNLYHEVTEARKSGKFGIWKDV